MIGRSSIPLRGRLLSDVLRDQKLNGDWDGNPDQFVSDVMSEAGAGNTVTNVVSRNGRSIRVVDQPMRAEAGSRPSRTSPIGSRRRSGFRTSPAMMR